MTAEAPAAAEAAPARPRLPNFIAFTLAVALVWLGGQFVRQGVSDSYVADQPDLAVLWLGSSSDAVTSLARLRLRGHDAQGAARLATKALQLWPLNEPALGLYGMAMDQMGLPQRANAAMSLAGGLGWRDAITQMWLFRRDVLVGNYPSGFERADALMRRQEVPSLITLQILAVAARDPKAIAPLAARLAANPSWRGRFLDVLAGARLTATEDALLTRLAGTSSPPTNAEIASYLVSLAQQGQYQQAEAAWRRFSPASAGAAAGANAVHDGDFERPPGSRPFDWSLPGGVGWTPSIGDSPGAGGHGKALNLQYDGVSNGQRLQQLVVLAPGAYQLSGRFYDEGGAGAQTVAWTVTCVGGDAPPIAKAPPPAGTAGSWRSFSLGFTVPSQGCPAQWLKLAAQAGEVRQDVAVWYDDLAITPASAPGT